MVGYAEGLGGGTGSTHARHCTLLHGACARWQKEPNFAHEQANMSARESRSGPRGREYDRVTTFRRAGSSYGGDGVHRERAEAGARSNPLHSSVGR